MGPVRTEGWGGNSTNGALSRSVRDSAALLDATHGLEPGSRYSAPEPEGTFLLWMDFRQLEMAADELIAFLRNEAGWVVSRGQAFGDEGIGFARVNIACPRSRLERALDSLARAIAAL